MPTITYGEKKVASALPRKKLRKALSIAERAGVEAASKRVDLPIRLVKFFCFEAGLAHLDLNPYAHQKMPKETTMNLRFIYPESRDELFISLHKGPTGKFRFSSAALGLLGVAQGDEVRVAINEDDEDEHFYVTVSTNGARDAVRVSSYGSRQLGFSAPGLAEELGLEHIPEARRFQLNPEPVGENGITLYKATLLREN